MFPLPVPPLVAQERIMNKLDTQLGLIDQMEQLQAAAVAQCDALLPSILDKAFRGEL